MDEKQLLAQLTPKERKIVNDFKVMYTGYPRGNTSGMFVPDGYVTRKSGVSQFKTLQDRVEFLILSRTSISTKTPKTKSSVEIDMASLLCACYYKGGGFWISSTGRARTISGEIITIDPGAFLQLFILLESPREL